MLIGDDDHAPGDGARATPPGGAGERLGVAYRDPQDTYTMAIDPDWEEQDTGTTEVERWTIAEPVDDHASNISVQTEHTLLRDLEHYLQNAEDNASQMGLGDFSKEIVTGTNGNRLGILEWTVPATEEYPAFHYFAVIDVRGGRAVVAILLTHESAFEPARVRVEDYLLTLQAS